MLPDKYPALRISLADALLMPDLRRRLNPFRIENTGNLHRGHTIRVHPEHPADCHRLILGDHEFMPVLRILGIPKRWSGTYRLTLFFHSPDRCLYFYGQILAIQIIEQILEIHINIRHIPDILLTVIFVID